MQSAVAVIGPAAAVVAATVETGSAGVPASIEIRSSTFSQGLGQSRKREITAVATTPWSTSVARARLPERGT